MASPNDGQSRRLGPRRQDARAAELHQGAFSERCSPARLEVPYLTVFVIGERLAIGPSFIAIPSIGYFLSLPQRRHCRRPVVTPSPEDRCLLGRGAFGEVRRVFDRNLERAVAMKLPGGRARARRIRRPPRSPPRPAGRPRRRGGGRMRSTLRARGSKHRCRSGPAFRSALPREHPTPSSAKLRTSRGPGMPELARET